MEIYHTGPGLRAAVSAVIADDMRTTLIGSRAPLSDPAACSAALVAAGFEWPSIAALLGTAISLARGTRVH